MVEFLAEKEVISDENTFFKAIMNRENLMSTGIGKNVAIPHARHESISELKIAVYHLEHEIEFDSIDRKNVKIILMICIPEDMKKEYMRVLSSISNFFQSEENRNNLFKANSPLDVYTILEGIKV
jgi:fructose-specific phosphotransferase system IIA component